MITESTKLVTTFLNSDRKKYNWTYQDVDTSLSAEEIKEACELLTTLDLFEQDGVKLFDSVVTAKVLTHRERLIFDPENDCAPDEPQSNEPNCAEERYFEVSDTSEKTKEIRQTIKRELCTTTNRISSAFGKVD